MKKAYFSIPNIATSVLPDDPGKIWNLAMDYRNLKNNFNAKKEGLLGKPNLSFMDKVDGVVGDIGSASGLGLTMLGAKLRQYEKTKQLGTNLKRHGVNVLTDDNLNRAYGMAIPTVGVIGGAALLSKAADELKPENTPPTYLTEPYYEY